MEWTKGELVLMHILAIVTALMTMGMIYSFINIVSYVLQRL